MQYAYCKYLYQEYNGVENISAIQKGDLMPYLEATESSGTPERGGHSAGVHKEIGHLAHNALDLNIPKGSHTLTIGGVEVKVETSP